VEFSGLAYQQPDKYDMNDMTCSTVPHHFSNVANTNAVTPSDRFYPEAIPLRNIKTPAIVKALVKFFTLVGLPKIIQSDQGSNFMSRVFQQVVHQLGIQQLKSSRSKAPCDSGW
jgi:hypothetical protein